MTGFYSDLAFIRRSLGSSDMTSVSTGSRHPCELFAPASVMGDDLLISQHEAKLAFNKSCIERKTAYG